MKQIRCAIYTRKSSDEGLDKEFNTLEAQRESALSYIQSQKHQGWVALPTIYDDGGFSGGNMNRPAFQRLLADIKDGKIDMIVVYKIDRLTRSLTDFSKMVEVFDKHNCSFTSVTQNFNTADSMGRLTLNMLLSFAQFEREVSSERIRDKVSASKKKGMWMGGVVPLGYVSKDKKLVIEPQSAEVVQFIFAKYLKHKSTIAVANLATDAGYKPMRRDAVRRILLNPVYIGKVKHKDLLHDGQHDPIIDVATFNAVQEIIKTKDISKRSCLFKKNEVGILRGLLTCGCCHTSMTPANCQTRGIRRYYYTSTKSKYYGAKHCHNGAIPVPVLDACILKIIAPMLSDTKVLHTIIQKVASDKSTELFRVMQTPEKIIARMSEQEKFILMQLLIVNITIHYDTMEINWTELGQSLLTPTLKAKTTADVLVLDLPFVRRKGALEINLPEDIAATTRHNPELIKALCKAFRLQKRIREDGVSIKELAFEEEMDDAYLGRLIRLSYLAPDIIKAILAGTQPPTIVLQNLLRQPIPAIWSDQRKLFKFPKV